jgi:inner membrane protein
MGGLVEHFAQHHDHLLYAIAGLCLVLELGALGMSGPLLFIALGSLVTGFLVSLSILASWESEMVSVGVLTVLSAALLWKPLKRFQNAKVEPDTSSDMIGRSLPVTMVINRDQGRVSYSGIEWQARLAEGHSDPISEGSRAQVVAVDGSLLLVKAA